MSSGKRVAITSLSNAERRIHHERGQNSMSRLPLLLQGEPRLSERGASLQEHSHMSGSGSKLNILGEEAECFWAFSGVKIPSAPHLSLFGSPVS